jgi:tRNA-2-methylthio-N6-dimethylallyladenosine synthase
MVNINKNHKKIYIKTYGCQMNSYDSDRILELFNNHGYTVTNDYEDANLVILNTCHIREKASEKVYSELGRINVIKSKAEKNMIIAVAGCTAQAEGDQIIKRAPYVDVVVGPQSYHNLPELVKKTEINKLDNKVHLDFIEEKKFDFLPEERNNNYSVTAFLSVQEGCDKFCTYCVVPYTRGNEFSRPASKIIAEAKTLIDSGVKEITLLGQNVNAYHGQDQNGKIVNLGELIFKLNELDGLERIRYTTSHPSDMHDMLYEAHASCYKLMPFLHLPVQSGSSKILKLMNRKHKAEDYLKTIKKLRIAREDLAFSSDFIVGFPGETEEDFQATLDLVKEVKYAQCYSFKFSARPGTPATNMPDQIDEATKSERLTRLQAILKQQQYDFNKTFINKEVNILFERYDDNNLIGRSPYLQPVLVDYQAEYYKKILPVKIYKAGPHNLKGKVLC